MQPIFDATMRANDLVEASGRQRRAEQIIGGLERCCAGGFADAFDLADSGQAGPLMVFDQPCDVGRDRGRAAFVRPWSASTTGSAVTVLLAGSSRNSATS